MKMKLSIAILAGLLASGAQALAAVWPDACGKDDVQFKVKTDKKQPVAIEPEADKAKIVFIESVQGSFIAAPLARFGVDGAWVGANKGLSYFTLSVPAGDHHLCAVRQSSLKEDKENVGVKTLTAQPGKVYFFEFKIVRTEVGGVSLRASGGLPGDLPNSDTKQKETIDSVQFKSLSDDEARTLLKAAALSQSMPKS